MDDLITKLGNQRLTMELDSSTSVQTATMSSSMNLGSAPSTATVTASATSTMSSQPPTNSNTTTTPTLGLIVPGGPVRTDFVPVDASGTKFALTLTSPGDLPSPLTTVNELICFLGVPLPPNQGLLLYWQLTYGNGNTNLQQQQQQSGFELLGALTMERSSEIFRTGWSEHDQFLAIPPQQPVTITIGVSMEPLESVQNVAYQSSSNPHSNKNPHAKRPMVAQKIAQDLFNFMESFDTGASGMNHLVVPKNIFERWWKRFEAKSKRDPNFFLKNTD